MKKVIIASALLATGSLVLLAGCGAKEKVYTNNNTQIVIGVTGPLTGDAANYGLGVKNAAQMAINNINDQGGLNGKKFTLVALDDQCSADKANKNYYTEYEQGMQISLGGVTSGACLEYAALAKKDKVFCLTPSATNDGVPQVGDNTYQMCFSDSGQGTAAATYIKENYSGKKIGVFYDSSDDYSKGIYDNFKKSFTGTFTQASFTNDTNTNFATQISTLKDCDFIFMPIYYTQAALFIDQAKGKISDSAVYYGCDGLDGIDSVENFDVYDYPQEISYLSHFNANSDDETTISFVNSYKSEYASQKDTLNQFGAAAYDCVYAIYQALSEYEAEGNTIEVTAKPSEFYKILTDKFQNGFTFSGVTGKNIKWNKDGTVDKTATKYIVNADTDK